MTRLPGDAFLPLGPPEYAAASFPAPVPSDPCSIISPFALPRAAMGYFDQQVFATSRPSGDLRPVPTQGVTSHGPPTKARSNHVYSPLSPGLNGPALPQSPYFLSPRIAQATQDAPRMLFQQHPQPPAIPSPTSPDDAPSQAQMIKRLVQQNLRMREAWECERKYLEANRERAEEVYKEERALMEGERAGWEAERDVFLRQIASLKRCVADQQSSVRLPGKTMSGNSTGSEMSSSAQPGLRGGAVVEVSLATPIKSLNMCESGEIPTSTSGLGAVGASHVAFPSSQGGFMRSSRPPRFTPAKTSPFVPMAPSGCAPDHQLTSGSPPEGMGPAPTVDVREIIPTLEGIPIKATAIKKSTFTDSQPSPPSATSEYKSPSKASSPPADAPKPALTKRSSQTLQVLAAAETDRLTMHAGHTPSHSLSLLPTVTASAAGTGSSSGNSTPTQQQSASACTGANSSASCEPQEPFPTLERQLSGQDDSEPVLQPDDDVALKGPLMVRNMPAHDEIFFKKLSDRLEAVSKTSDAAVPAVLRLTPAPEELHDVKATRGQTGTDPAPDPAASQDSSTPTSAEEIDIPLKLKKVNNFGAPFGEFR